MSWRRKLLIWLTLLCFCLPLHAQPYTPPEHRRSEEQTFLTFPEWFLVHSPAEYAQYVRDHDPSDFPFWGHIAQFWQSYAAVTKATQPYPFNGGYHLMILVIGASTTVEYALRSVYETLIGRLSQLSLGKQATTPEDRYAATVAQDYVDFIRVLPWYEYDFLAKLTGLWREVPMRGPGLLRKWERRYALTTEYGIKAIYGYLIKLATQSAYDTARLDTAVLIDHAPAQLPALLPKAQHLADLPGQQSLLLLDRYEAFKWQSALLARQGANFREIAGNGPNAALLITIIVPQHWPNAGPGTRLLFTQPILTQPGLERRALIVTVATLAEQLRALDHPEITLEHVYDY